MLRVSIIIPALNEENTLPKILKKLMGLQFSNALIQEIIVCDNGSTDNTSQVVIEHGATLVQEPVMGYGRACLAAINHVEETDVLLFINADGAENLQEATLLIEAIHNGADLAVGSRMLGSAETGSLYPHQKAGNQFAVWVINKLYKTQLTDLGPFRAIRYSLYQQLSMQDRDFGWIIEMQLKCLSLRAGVIEIPTTTYVTTEASKISGTVRGSMGAAYKILAYLLMYSLKEAKKKIQNRVFSRKKIPDIL